MGFARRISVSVEDCDEFAPNGPRALQVCWRRTEHSFPVRLRDDLPKWKDRVASSQAPEKVFHNVYAFGHRQEPFGVFVTNDECLCHVHLRQNSVHDNLGQFPERVAAACMTKAIVLLHGFGPYYCYSLTNFRPVTAGA